MVAISVTLISEANETKTKKTKRDETERKGKERNEAGDRRQRAENGGKNPGIATLDLIKGRQSSVIKQY